MREAVMMGEMSISFPLPLWKRVAPHEVRRRGEGFLRFDELCENVLQNGRGPLQYIIVPVTRDSKTFGHQNSFSRCVTRRRCVLTAIDLDDDALFKANEVENEVLKRDLAAKFEKRKPSIPEQTPHGCFGVCRFATH